MDLLYSIPLLYYGMFQYRSIIVVALIILDCSLGEVSYQSTRSCHFT